MANENFETQDINVEEQVKGTNDFEETDYGAYGADVVDEAMKKARTRQIKTDVISAGLSVAWSIIPMAVAAHSRKNDPIPYKPSTMDYVRASSTALIPIIKAVDTIAFHGALQNKIAEKTSFSLNDVRNIVNFISLYQPLHTVTVNYMENINRQQKQQQAVPLSGGIKTATFLSIANLVTPFVVDKFTDTDLTFSQRFASVMPVKMFGGIVRKIACTNPKVAQMYDVANAAVKVASFGNNTLSNAVRPTQGSTLNKTSNAISGILDFASDVMGMSRGNVNSPYVYNYNNGYGQNGWNNGASRWSY